MIDEKEIEAVLKDIAAKVGESREGITLGIALMRVRDADATLAGALERAIGLATQMMVREAFLAGAREGRLQEFAQPKPGASARLN